jgi:hypothetical protein
LAQRFSRFHIGNRIEEPVEENVPAD